MRGLIPITDGTTHDDESGVDKPIHEGSMVIPSVLLPDEPRRIPVAVNAKYGTKLTIQTLSAPALRLVTAALPTPPTRASASWPDFAPSNSAQRGNDALPWINQPLPRRGLSFRWEPHWA